VRIITIDSWIFCLNTLLNNITPRKMFNVKETIINMRENPYDWTGLERSMPKKNSINRVNPIIKENIIIFQQRVKSNDVSNDFSQPFL
jgi:hypothetical protein